jgi:aminoglycoside 3-N-acetyltransferase
MKNILIKIVARKLTPKYVLDLLRHKRRVKKFCKIKESTKSLKISNFDDILRGLNISPNSNVFIHSGSDWLGEVDGGVLSVVKSITEYFKRGTVIMPSFAMEGMAAEYLDENVFSVNKTASKMGLITEIFRRYPNVERSAHPTHSVCALGANSKYITSSHEKCIYPFEESSPFGKLAKLKGKILLIGVGLEVLTHVHVVEDQLGEDFPVRVYEGNIRKVKIFDTDESTVIVNTYVHNPSISLRKNINQFELEFLEKNIMKLENVLGVEIRVIDVNKLEMFLYGKAINNITIYD